VVCVEARIPDPLVIDRSKDEPSNLQPNRRRSHWLPIRQQSAPSIGEEFQVFGHSAREMSQLRLPDKPL
jgi:hypothetical protein